MLPVDLDIESAWKGVTSGVPAITACVTDTDPWMGREAARGRVGVTDRQAMSRCGMLPTLRFERPHSARADSYRSLIAEFVACGEALIPFPLMYATDDFDALLRQFDECRRGAPLAEGFVANSTFWLVAEDQVVAVSNLRHALTDSLRREGGHIGYGVRPSARGSGHATAILRHTLDEARALGIHDVLVTCAKENEPSARTIIRCGGRLDSEEWIEGRGETVQRYWIALRAS